MSIKECLYKAALSFFVLSALIAAAIAIVGMLVEPDARIGYGDMLAPLKFAAASVLSTFVMLSKHELSTAEYLVRKALQLVVIEGEILAICYTSADINAKSAGTLAVIAVSVLVVFAVTHGVLALGDYLTAQKLTESLQNLQKNANAE